MPTGVSETLGTALAIPLAAAVWLLITWPIFLIGRKFNLTDRRIAFIPIIGLFVLTTAANKSRWILLWALIPFGIFPVLAILYGRICRASGLMRLWGWVVIFPSTTLLFMWLIAIAARPDSRPFGTESPLSR